MFIIDDNETTEYRKQQNENLDKEILQQLHNVILNNNMLAESYVMMHNEVQSQRLLNNNNQNMKEFDLGFITKQFGVNRGR